MISTATVPPRLAAEPGGPAFLHLEPSVLGRAVTTLPDEASFIRSWDRLPLDCFSHDNGTYRRRRYSQFRIVDTELVSQPHRAFFQSTEVNSANGGVHRLFEPVEPEVRRSRTLRTAVLHLLDLLPSEYGRELTGIGVHQIRIVAAEGAPGLPTPEGIHQDGHYFVGQVLIHRGAVSGGESTLYDLERRPIFRTTLRSRWESIIIDDRRVFHSVDGIRVLADSDTTRDMLLIDFNPA